MGKGQEQEPAEKPQESVIQEREQGQGQEQVQERTTQEEEQVSSPKRCWQQIPIKISFPLLNCEITLFSWIWSSRFPKIEEITSLSHLTFLRGILSSPLKSKKIGKLQEYICRSKY